MRVSHHYAFGLLVGSGVALTGAVASVGCNGDGFDGCQASRTCPARAGAAGSANGGEAGDGAGGKGGRSGSGAAGGASGVGGSAGTRAASSGGSGGSGHAGSGAGGGTGGTHGHASESAGGSDAGAPDAPSAGSGGGGHGVSEEGGAAGVAGADAEPEPPGDTTAPKIVVTAPANNAKGVRSDASILVTFSERMDNAATEAAYQSTTLPRDAVNLFWQSDSTVLVIQPKEPLAYAELDDPSGDAKYYSFTIAGTATDVAGNPLGADGTFVFTTARHITQTLPVMENGGVQVEGNGGDFEQASVTCASPEDLLSVGDTNQDHGLCFLVSFDLNLVPLTVVEWRSATLLATNLHLANSLNPFSRLGDVQLGGLVTSAPTNITTSTGFTTPIGTFARYASQSEATSGVLAVLEADHQNRQSHQNVSRYELRFDELTDGDGKPEQVRVACQDLTLALDYLAE
jgi:hypothetical protein